MHFYRLRQQHGFTLIELMVVIIVLGILSTVAYPSYQQYLLRAHRAHAKTQLLQAAQWMEHAATAAGSYPTHAQHTESIAQVQNQLGNARYAIGINSNDGQRFTVSAIPIGAQSKDLCGQLNLSHTGERSISNTPMSSNMTALQCWER